jgi:hypothetical protein
MTIGQITKKMKLGHCTYIGMSLDIKKILSKMFCSVL